MPIGLPGTVPPGLAQLEWCASFTGPARAAIHALKYQGERRLATPLGELLAARWVRAGTGGDVLVPVPVHASRLRERGYNQAALIARAAGAALHLPVVESLVRRESTEAQHALGRAARAVNVGGAFAPAAQGPLLKGRWIVLIDDVMTTGATLSACAAIAANAGALAVSALTVARER
ncbi:hypothetical protein BH20CHL6_BH20CHL6_05670 [soil metagenome]